MKRLLVLAGMAATLAAVGAQPAVTAGDTRGPACANVTDGSIFYSSTGTLTADVFLAKPACSNFTYAFTVYTTGGALLASSSTYTSCAPEVAGGGCVEFTFDLTNGGATTAPSTVCVSGDTSVSTHVADHAPDIPDASCATSVPTTSVVINGSPAQPFH